MLKLIQINLYILYFIKASQQKQNLKINFIIYFLDYFIL